MWVADRGRSHGKRGLWIGAFEPDKDGALKAAKITGTSFSASACTAVQS